MNTTEARIALLTKLLEAETARADRYRDEARTDPGTGIQNRRAFNERVKSLMDRAKGFSFVLVDITNLKSANTALGHEGADDVIREVAQGLRAQDEVMRIGGDEFAVLPRGAGDDPRAIRDRIEATFPALPLGKGVSVFLVAAYGRWEPGMDLREVMIDTDHALEARKAEVKAQRGEVATREEALKAVGS